MDLRQTYKVTIEALEKEEQELAQGKQSILDKEVALNKREKEIAEVIKQLEVEQRAVRDIKDIKAQKEANELRDKGLKQLELQLKNKENELKKYENKLFEIKNQQDFLDRKLRERETEVALREKTYKEEVEKAFASNLAKNLLTK